MKRSKILFIESRHHAVLAFAFFLTSAALGIWAAGVALTSLPGGGGLAIAALVALWMSWAHAGECARLRRLARKERAYETDLSARMLRRGFDSVGNLIL